MMITKLALALFALPAALCATQSITVGSSDLYLSGGASFVPGHGAPTGMSVRTGNPGQTSAAAFKLVLAPGSTLTSVDFSFRYVTGYGPTGVGANLSLSVTGGGSGGDHHPLYASPHFVDHSYSHNNSDYSAPVAVHVSGIALAADADADSRLTLTVANNGRNLQILVPLQVTVSCTGADKCLVPGAAPTPPPTPAPPPPAFSFAASYGDHMVLQRAPQRATIWGFTNCSAPRSPCSSPRTAAAAPSPPSAPRCCPARAGRPCSRRRPRRSGWPAAAAARRHTP